MFAVRFDVVSMRSMNRKAPQLAAPASLTLRVMISW